MIYLLDASALLALLRREPGSEKVAEILDQSRIHALNLGEVVRKLAEKGMPRVDVENLLGALSLNVIEEFTEKQAYELGSWALEARGLGLSLGDCICMTTAERHNLIPVTADRTWSSLTSIGSRVMQIR